MAWMRTDKDYCKGEVCKVKGLCWRHDGYLSRKKSGLSTEYPLTPTLNEEGFCDRLAMKEFYGN